MPIDLGPDHPGGPRARRARRRRLGPGGLRGRDDPVSPDRVHQETGPDPRGRARPTTRADAAGAATRSVHRRDVSTGPAATAARTPCGARCHRRAARGAGDRDHAASFWQRDAAAQVAVAAEEPGRPARLRVAGTSVARGRAVSRASTPEVRRNRSRGSQPELDRDTVMPPSHGVRPAPAGPAASGGGVTPRRHGQRHHDGHGFETSPSTPARSRTRATGAVVPPIYPTSHLQAGRRRRAARRLRVQPHRPTRPGPRCEECLAALEGGGRGLAFASGLAAEDTLLRAVLPRPATTSSSRTTRTAARYRLFAKVAERWGLDYTAVHVADLDAVRAARPPGSTKVIWVETPTNPLLGIADIAALAGVAHDARRAAGRRQHVRLAVPAAAARARRRRGRALDDEVPRRPLRRGRRRAGACATTSSAERAAPSTRTRWARSPARSTPG